MFTCLYIYIDVFLSCLSQEVSAQEAGSDVMAGDESTPTEPDLTAGKRDVFLVDVRATF